MDELDPASLAARWKPTELRLTGFPADLGSDARSDQVSAEVCPTRRVEMGHRDEAAVCFLQPGRVRPGWSGGPVTRADTGAAIAVFHSVYRPKQQPDLAYPCASVLFQLVPLLKAAGADPAAFAHPAPPTLPHAPDAADRVARQIRSLTLAASGDWRKV